MHDRENCVVYCYLSKKRKKYEHTHIPKKSVRVCVYVYISTYINIYTHAHKTYYNVYIV